MCVCVCGGGGGGGGDICGALVQFGCYHHTMKSPHCVIKL